MSAKSAIADSICNTMTDMQECTAIRSLASSSNNLRTIVNNVTGESIFTVMITLAQSILIVYVLWHLVDSVLQDKRDPDGIFKDIALLFFFGYITKHTPELVRGLATAGDTILGRITVGIRGTADSVVSAIGIAQEPGNSNFKSELEQKNLFVLVLDALVYSTLGRLINWIIGIIARVAIYTVKIEVYIRTMFFPLAIASLPEGGLQGAGGRYMKHYLGCFLQFSIIDIALTAYPTMVAAAVATPGETFIVGLAACAFAVVGICMKASSLANEVAGA